MGLYAVIALANALQGWVGEVGGTRASARMKAALVAHSLLGLAGAVLLSVVGSSATRVLYGESLAAPRGTMIWLGLAFLFVSLNTCVGRLILIPLHQDTAVLASTLLGAIIGVPALISGGILAGSEGGAFGLAISQCVVLLVQFAALVRYRSRAGTATPSSI